jgi:hypothetical protein
MTWNRRYLIMRLTRDGFRIGWGIVHLLRCRVCKRSYYIIDITQETHIKAAQLLEMHNEFLLLPTAAKGKTVYSPERDRFVCADFDRPIVAKNFHAQYASDPAPRGHTRVALLGNTNNTYALYAESVLHTYDRESVCMRCSKY